MYKNTKENGITLVALVITIIVLLILAGVTISYISGGIIDKTKVAIKDYENADNRQQGAIDDIGEYNKEGIDLEPIYNEEGVEDNIAPTDLFEYEIINDGSIASSYMQNLPTKTAKITGINPNYIERQNLGYREWYYKIKYDGITDVLVIPYQVELDENGKVTENGEMYKITEVDLSVRGYSYGTNNYYGKSFPSIKKVIYPNTVEKVDKKENIDFIDFANVQQPSEIILSKKLTNIGKGFFSNTSIESIEIPEGVNNINDYTFSQSSIRNITIPNGVTNIGNYAFYGCEALTSITIPNSVTNIGDSAFLNCTSLTNIEIPNSVTNIGNSTFSKCTSLTNIEIPDSVTSIGDSAFNSCENLKNITIPNGVTNIGDSVFSYCYSLTSIKIPSSIKKVGVFTFGYCNNIKEIVIPGNIEYIGERAFQNWTSNQTIYFECSEENSKNWNYNWKKHCNAKIVWNYNPNEATE